MEDENSLLGYTVPETPPQPNQEENENRDMDHERNEVVCPGPSSPSLTTPLVRTPSVINLDCGGTVCEENNSVGYDKDDILDSPMDVKERDPQNVDSEDPFHAETGEVVPRISFDAEGENSMAGSQGKCDVESNNCEEDDKVSGVEVKDEPEEEEQEEKPRWVESLNYCLR